MDIDKKLVQDTELTFIKENLTKTMLLNDDGIVELYEDNKLTESKPFSKITVERDYKRIIQEGYTLQEETTDIKYNIYTLCGEDGVYNSHFVETVDSLEQAEDRVAELQAEGSCSAYYKTVQNGKELNESENLDLDKTEQELKDDIEQVDKAQELKDELETKLDKLYNESRVNRKLHKGDKFINPNGVECTIIDVDEEHLLDGEPQVTYQIGKDYKCYKQSSVNSMLDQNKYTLQENLETVTTTEETYSVYNSEGEMLEEFNNKEDAINFAKGYNGSSIIYRKYINNVLDDTNVKDIKIESSEKTSGAEVKKVSDENKIMPSSTLTSKKLTKQEILDMNQVPVSNKQMEFLFAHDIGEEDIILGLQDVVKQMKYLQKDKPFISIEEYVNEVINN